MNAVTTRRWVEGDTVWFAVSINAPELQFAAPRLLMDYQRVGQEWRRGYPAGTSHLETAWQNFARYIEPVLRQASRLEPVPWRDALAEFCRRTSPRTVDWWLTGSAALALRGAPIEPGDLDLVCGERAAVELGDLFRDVLIEPVTRADEQWISEWWGRAFCRARIEWIGGAKPSADEPAPSDFGPTAASRLETVKFERWTIQVPPLDLQRAVSERRGLTDRVAMIDALAG
jgi:hypothetical protein